MTEIAHDTVIDVIDKEERARARAKRRDQIGKWAMPFIVFALLIFAWDRIVVINQIPHYILPGPGLVFDTMVKDWPILSSALVNTLLTTLAALLVAVIGGAGLAILFTQSRLMEMSVYPYAVVLQVTPIVAIAPLIFIYVDNRLVGLLICAWIVAFFPVLSNTTLGLKSADHNLRDLFNIYGASRWQRLRYLQLPSALPYFLGGLRIAGGLALIGAVVAEFVAGTAGIGTGLAYTILEASYRLNIPRMFAGLFLIAGTGVSIYGRAEPHQPPPAAQVARKRHQAGKLTMDFRTLPDIESFVLKNCSVPKGLRGPEAGFSTTDIAVSGGRISASPSGPEIDMGLSIALPAFTDMHTHLDKGHIWRRAANPDGTFMGALTTTAEDREDAMVGRGRANPDGFRAALRLRPRHQRDPYPYR